MKVGVWKSGICETYEYRIRRNLVKSEFAVCKCIERRIKLLSFICDGVERIKNRIGISTLSQHLIGKIKDCAHGIGPIHRYCALVVDVVIEIAVVKRQGCKIKVVQCDIQIIDTGILAYVKLGKIVVFESHFFQSYIFAEIYLRQMISSHEKELQRIVCTQIDRRYFLIGVQCSRFMDSIKLCKIRIMTQVKRRDRRFADIKNHQSLIIAQIKR